MIRAHLLSGAIFGLTCLFALSAPFLSALTAGPGRVDDPVAVLVWPWHSAVDAIDASGGIVLVEQGPFFAVGYGRDAQFHARLRALGGIAMPYSALIAAICGSPSERPT